VRGRRESAGAPRAAALTLCWCARTVWALPRDAAIDLVCRLLVVDPVSRLSVAEALTHRWFQKESLDLSGLS